MTFQTLLESLEAQKSMNPISRPRSFVCRAVLLLAASWIPEPLAQAQEGQTEEPRFYTPFARRFLGDCELVAIVDVRSTARIGVTEKVIAQVEIAEVLVGEAPPATLPVLTDLGHGLVTGSRALLFLDRKERTLQYWALGCVRREERNFMDKLELVRDYLAVAGLEAEKRFPKVLETLEGRLLRGSAWARWNALRELADLAVSYPARIEAEHLRRWELAGGDSALWKQTVARLEREWRKARKAIEKKP